MRLITVWPRSAGKLDIVIEVLSIDVEYYKVIKDTSFIESVRHITFKCSHQVNYDEFYYQSNIVRSNYERIIIDNYKKEITLMCSRVVENGVVIFDGLKVN